MDTYVVELMLLIAGCENHIHRLVRGKCEKDAMIRALEEERHDTDSEIDKENLACDDIEYSMYAQKAVLVAPEHVAILERYL